MLPAGWANGYLGDRALHSDSWDFALDDSIPAPSNLPTDEEPWTLKVGSSGHWGLLGQRLWHEHPMRWAILPSGRTPASAVHTPWLARVRTARAHGNDATAMRVALDRPAGD